jgi:hypothetical protein
MLAVMNCIASLQTGPLKKDKCNTIRPLILTTLKMPHPTTPPEGMLAATFLTAAEELVHLKTRLFTLMLHLSQPKNDLMRTDDPEVIDCVIELLHTAPISTACAKDLLVYARHFFLKLKKAEEDLVVYLATSVQALVGGGRLFAQHTSASSRSIVYTIVQDVLSCCIKHLPIAVLDGLMDVFAVELLNSHLSAAVHSKALEVMRVIQEQFTVTASEVAGAPPHDTGPKEKAQAMRAALGKTLTVVLYKLEEQSVVVRHHLCLCCFSGCYVLVHSKALQQFVEMLRRLGSTLVRNAFCAC